MTAYLEIQLIAIVISLACAVPGCILVVRHMAMMSDAITHTILLGIVLGFFAAGDLASPLLFIGAGCIGVVTVWLAEMLQQTKKVTADSAIGLVYPMLFSVAIILITKYGSYIHLDTDAVMLGELAFVPFDRLYLGSIDIGPTSLYTCGLILLVNVTLVTVFYKEVKLSTFDPLLASVLGFAPLTIHFIVMSMVSVTSVLAFDAVGSILVVALMIGPANTAYLLSKNLKTMMILACIFTAISTYTGVWVAFYYDVSIAGSIACMIGVVFLVVYVITIVKKWAR